MRISLIALVGGLAVLLAPVGSRGQTCPVPVPPSTGPCTAGPLPGDPKVVSAYPGQVLPWSKHFIALTRLGDQYISLYDGDSLTEPLWLTGGAVSSFNGTGFRETWYIPRDPIGSTASMFRLYSGPPANDGQGGSNLYDHMDSPSSGEGYPNYGPDLRDAQNNPLPLGYPWSTPPPGSLPLTRYFNGSIFNHVTYLSDLCRPRVGAVEGSGYSLDASYSTSTATPRYGFQRFNTCLGDAPAALGDTLSNGTLSVHLNPVWGNAIDGITHIPSGRPQLIDPSIGAMVQSVVRFGIPRDPNYPCPGCIGNVFPISPGEAGGVATNAQYGDDTSHGGVNYVPLWAGSPTTSITTSSNFRQTELRPLNFEFDIAPGGEPGNTTSKTNIYTPLMWRGVFRRTTQLGYTANGVALPGVIHLLNEVRLDSDAPAEMDGEYNLNHTWFMYEAPFQTTGDYTVELYSVDFGAHLLPSFTPPQRVYQTFTQIHHVPDDEALVIRSNDGSFAVAMLAPYSSSDAELILQAGYWYGPEWIFDTFRLADGVNRVTYSRDDTYMVIGTLADVTDQLPRIVCQEKGLCGGPQSFYTLPPCRLVDTRNPNGAYGGPAFSGSMSRTFMMAQQCGVPATAKALSLNIAVTGPTADGWLSLYPGGVAQPAASMINYSAGDTRANAVTVPVGLNGQLSVAAGQATGAAVHVIIDVSGYFQ